MLLLAHIGLVGSFDGVNSGEKEKMSAEKPFLEVPPLEEIEVSDYSLEEIAKASDSEEECQSLLLEALAEKAKRKEKKKREKEKRDLAKLAKKIRLLEKKEAAQKRKARKRCPFTGKYAWKNNLWQLKLRNVGGRDGNGRLKRARRDNPAPMPSRIPPLCKVCNRHHW